MHAPTEIVDLTSSFHVARSRVIDAFADVEAALIGLLHLAEKKVTTAPISQKIASVRKIEPSPRYATRRRDEVSLALDELTPLLSRRAEITHSRMTVYRSQPGRLELAGFANPVDQVGYGTAIRGYSVEDLQRLEKDVRRIAATLRA